MKPLAARSMFGRDSIFGLKVS